MKLALPCAFLLACLAAPARAAVYGCDCVCGIHLSAPCGPQDCMAKCGGGRSSASSPGTAGLGAQEQIMMNLFGAFMNGAMNAMQPGPQAPAQPAADPAWAAQQRAAQEEAARREAESRRLAHEKFAKEKAEAEKELRGPSAPGEFQLKDEEPPAPPERSILQEAQELLRRAAAADDAAARALAGGS